MCDMNLFKPILGRKRQKQTKQGNEKGDRPRLALKRTSFMNYLYWLRTLSGKRNSSTILTKFKSNYGTSLHELRRKSQHVRLKSDSYGTSLHELREKSQHVRLTSDMWWYISFLKEDSSVFSYCKYVVQNKEMYYSDNCNSARLPQRESLHNLVREGGLEYNYPLSSLKQTIQTFSNKYNFCQVVSKIYILLKLRQK